MMLSVDSLIYWMSIADDTRALTQQSVHQT